MPGLDFDRLRAEITMQQVLTLLGFEPLGCTGDQWYGCCPLHEASSHRSRAFSVNVALRRYYCHQCRSHGNQLELWAAYTRQPLYAATLDLCRVLGHSVPWVQRW